MRAQREPFNRFQARLRLLLGLVGLCTLLSGAARAELAGDPEAGLEAARDWCAQCHVIGDYNPYGGVGSTPSFWIMRRKPDIYYGKLLTFQERRPHAARKFDLSPGDIENILKYVDSLEVK